MIKITATFELICGRCKVIFSRSTEFRADVSEVGISHEDASAATVAIIHASRMLRDLAQEDGWDYVLPVGQPRSTDLCPGCFVLPPEG